MENEEGVFEVDVSVDGVVLEIEPAADNERPISAADLPHVLDAVEATVPGAASPKPYASPCGARSSIWKSAPTAPCWTSKKATDHVRVSPYDIALIPSGI